MSGNKEIILALAREKGPQGLSGKEIQAAAEMPLPSIFTLCQQLEEEGHLRILAFSPLMVIERKALESIEAELLSLIQDKAAAAPDAKGIRKEALIRMSPLPVRILEWMIQRMIRAGKIQDDHGFLSVIIRAPELTPEEKMLLDDLRKMAASGEFRRLNMEEIQQRLRVSARSFDRLLEALLEEKKVIQSREDILFHSVWLDQIITALITSGKNKLTVSEFKQLTGLSRKLTIPLLELLDQRGITRKEGSVRIIL
jgi:selenocysteine-specific elongation factor